MKLPKFWQQIYRMAPRNPTTPRPPHNPWTHHPHPLDIPRAPIPKTPWHNYRPHTKYDGKVMFSVCLSTGGAGPVPSPVAGPVLRSSGGQGQGDGARARGWGWGKGAGAPPHPTPKKFWKTIWKYFQNFFFFFKKIIFLGYFFFATGIQPEVHQK